MGSFRDFFALPYWFYWTVASDGIRDARKNYPKEGHFREVNYYEESTSDLPSVEKKETRNFHFMRQKQ